MHGNQQPRHRCLILLALQPTLGPRCTTTDHDTARVTQLQLEPGSFSGVTEHPRPSWHVWLRCQPRPDLGERTDVAGCESLLFVTHYDDVSA